MKYDVKENLFSTIFVMSLLICVSIFIMICKHKTDAYTVEIESTKISEVNLNDDRTIIGYADTAYGVARVYDRSYRSPGYIYTYQYTYNDKQYEYIYMSYTKIPDIIRIYLNPDIPSDFCFASEKVSLKEFITN